MNRYIAMALLMLIVISVGGKVDASNENVRVYVDQQLLQMKKDVQVKQGTAYIPMRPVFQALGAGVKWDSASKSISAVKDGHTVEIPVGRHHAYVDGKLFTLSTPSFIESQTTFVPLRFVSEALGAAVNWDPEAKLIRIMADAQDSLLENTMSQSPSIASLWIGDSLDQVTTRLGEPMATVGSAYSFEWLIYQVDDGHIHVGIEDEKVVAFYTNSHSFVRDLPFHASLTREDILAQASMHPVHTIAKKEQVFRYNGNGEWDIFEGNGFYYTLFYDILRNNHVTAIQIIAKDVEMAQLSYFGKATEELRASYEEHMFHLIQATRLKEGKGALVWDDKIAITAREHSDDMAENEYFSHTNLEGLSPFDRFDRDGIVFQSAGENLAMGQFHPIFAHQALMNSDGHRRNILAHTFERAGAGVAFRGDKPYYTINFYTPWK